MVQKQPTKIRRKESLLEKFVLDFEFDKTLTEVKRDLRDRGF